MVAWQAFLPPTPAPTANTATTPRTPTATATATSTFTATATSTFATPPFPPPHSCSCFDRHSSLLRRLDFLFKQASLSCVRIQEQASCNGIAGSGHVGDWICEGGKLGPCAGRLLINLGVRV